MPAHMRVPERLKAESVTAPSPIRQFAASDDPPATQTVGRLPDPVNLVLYQGDDLRFRIPLLQNGDPADLSDQTPSAQIKGADDDTVLATFACAVTDGNYVSFWLASADSTDLPVADDLRWDAQLVDGDGNVYTFVAGTVKVISQVTT